MQNPWLRRGIWAAVVVLALSALVYTWYFVLPPNMGAGPAGPPVPIEPFAQVLSERDAVLLGLGDSITAGYGASPGLDYMTRLLKNPPDEFEDMAGRNLRALFPALLLDNRAVSGSNSEECLERQIPALGTFAEKTVGIVCLTTGGNDLIHFYGRTPPREGAMYGATMEEARPWIENYRARLDAILEGIRAAFPGGCYIFLGNIYDPSDGVGDPEAARLPAWDDMLDILEAYNSVIAEAAARHHDVWLVDIHDTFLGHGVHARQFWREHFQADDPHYWYYDNLEDPNDRGYDALRRIALLKMLAAFEARPPERM